MTIIFPDLNELNKITYGYKRMSTIGDITHRKNVMYNAKTRCFEDVSSDVFDISDNTIEIIDTPVLVAGTLHSCYSHAIIDCTFPLYWAIDDLMTAGLLSDRNIILFIDKSLLNYPRQNLPLINVSTRTYNGSYKDIIEIITRNPVIFEHTLRKNILFGTVFFYPGNDSWQRSPWNCIEHYSSGRPIPRASVRFSDEIIYDKLRRFRTRVLSQHLTTSPDVSTNELIIIDRKHNRKYDSRMLTSLVELAEANTNWTYKGIYLLEDLSFTEQVQLFNRTRYYIVRHGSCLVNLLWTQPHSLVFEIMGGPQGITTNPIMYQRIADLTSSRVVNLQYTSVNPSRDIFSLLG